MASPEVFAAIYRAGAGPWIEVEWVQRGAPQSLTLPDPLNMLTEISPSPVEIRAEVSPGPRRQPPGRSHSPKGCRKSYWIYEIFRRYPILPILGVGEIDDSGVVHVSQT